ncbi:MAG: 5-methyltetrahydrofolate--homocysteine methyltransferase [Planctomycetota bacterium]|jgi:5-methyltetrahydrofolate--homocysteine methyltransferase
MGASLAQLLASRSLVLDGGMGSTLIARGLGNPTSSMLWNVERSEAIASVHEGFLRAGSHVIQTNSFGGNAVALARSGLGERCRELNLAAAHIARDVTQEVGSGLVAGNIGPTGLFHGKQEDPDLCVLDGVFALQVQALLDGGVDYFALETFSDTREVQAVLAAVRALSELPITVCLTFDRAADGFETLSGERLEDALSILAKENLAALGVNCSVGSAMMIEAAPVILEASDLPSIFKPNAGLPEIENKLPSYGQSAAEFATDMVELKSLGAAAIGGCCGCDARFIAALTT